MPKDDVDDDKGSHEHVVVNSKRKAKRMRKIRIPFRRPEEYDPALEPVVQQDALKMKLKSAFSQYTLFCNDEGVGRPIVCVYGESGSGKTYSVELMAKASGLPVTIASAGSLSPPSYKGTTMQDLLARHYMNFHSDQGVLYLDEIDKWCRGAIRLEKGQTLQMDEQLINGIRSQHELLRYIEMESINFLDLGRDIDEMTDVVFDTQRLLWVLSGAFVGLPAMIRRRLHNVHLTDEEVWEHAMPADFIAYGMVEELAKRVQTWAWTKPLNALDLVRILKDQEEPKWIRRFAAIGCELVLEPGAINAVALRAFEEHQGARGAMSLLRRSMDDLYDQVSREKLTRFVVDHNTVETGRIEVNVA